MANINILYPVIAALEGGYVNNSKDKGGATNMGVTIATWKKVGYDKNHDGDIDATDIKLLDKKDFAFVLRKYWDVWQADKICSQKIADILVDWVWGSGRWGVVIPQRIIGVNDDGKVGIVTLNAVNNANEFILLKQLLEAREKFLNNIVANNPSQQIFLNGWMKRLDNFR